MDRIIIHYSSNEEYTKRINNYLDFIKKETLADDIIKEDRQTAVFFLHVEHVDLSKIICKFTAKLSINNSAI